jgi:hypothetical protein
VMESLCSSSDFLKKLKGDALLFPFGLAMVAFYNVFIFIATLKKHYEIQ